LDYKFGSFKEIERAEIYWVGGFVTDKGRNWCAKVYLKHNDFVWYYLIPVGFLSSMFIGAEFNYGKFVPKKFITNNTLHNFDMSRIEFVPFHEMPSRLYSAHSNPAFKNELVCRYVSASKAYYIPQMEIIRAFFAINSTTTYSLLMPAGLDSLFHIKNHVENNVEIEFDKNFPKKNVNQSAAKYLASIKFEQALNDFWFSVFLSVKHIRNGKLFNPPSLNVSMECVSVKQGDNYLIKKINKIHGLPCPFEAVVFSHPLINDNVKIDRSISRNERKSGGRPKKGDESEADIVDDSYSSYDVNRPTSNPAGSSVYFGFKRQIHAQIKYNKTVEKAAGNNKSRKSGRPADTATPGKKFSAGLSAGEKAEKPIEFQSDMTSYYGSFRYGEFELFAEAVEILGVRPDQVRIGQLFGKTKFVMLDEYTRRNYAVVFLAGAIIIEIARPDRHPISTLIIKQSERISLSKSLHSLLQSVTKNNGHWDKDYLKEKFGHFCGFVKHMAGDTPQDYADRLRKAIDIF
jgi:hypothetical protein